MLNNQAHLHAKQDRTIQGRLRKSLALMVAILISLLLHLWLIWHYLPSFLTIFNEAFQHRPSTIEAKLVLKKTPIKNLATKETSNLAASKVTSSKEPIKKSIIPTKKVVKETAKKTPEKPEVTQIMQTETSDALIIYDAANDLNETNGAADAGHAVLGKDQTRSLEKIGEAVVSEDEADASAPQFLEEPLPIPYQTVETLFDVYVDPESKSNRATVGNAVVNFSMDNKAYQLKSEIKPHGLATLFIPDLLQTSVGKVDEKGLKPTHYLYKFGDKKSKTYMAEFDWDQQRLIMNTGKGEQVAPLSAGTQDLLSFMYQFMFSPPLNQMEVTVTTGKRLNTYYYGFEGEEIIQTKIGAINTVHILRSDFGRDEKTELWLAVEYRYLPVKIKKTEKDKSYELLARSIKTDQGALSVPEDKNFLNALPVEPNQENAQPIQINPFLNLQ